MEEERTEAQRSRPIRWLAFVVLGFVLLLGVATGVFWDDLMKTSLDPKTPFQTYKPPPAPDYARADAWWLLPSHPETPAAGEPAADVFFISPTTFDGGREWIGPIDDPKSERVFRRVMAPNYAGPFAQVGRVFAPRYRQASLYSLMTLREDARAARAFAYGDVERAFRFFLDHYSHDRPISRPRSASLQRQGSWADRRRVPGFNLFFANLEADAQTRVEAMVKPGRVAGQADSNSNPARPGEGRDPS
jgi:hypothetical protein